MRTITHIVIHCTATPQSTKIDSIQRYWRETLGWSKPGYHFIIEANGNIDELLPIEEPSNGVAGFNSKLINIAYVGGIDASGKPIDNRTSQQKAALIGTIKELKLKYPLAIIQGHRDFPGIIKACPSFDAKTTYANL